MRFCVALLALCFSAQRLRRASRRRGEEGATVIDDERIEGVGDLEVEASGKRRDPP